MRNGGDGGGERETEQVGKQASSEGVNMES